jgi:hypothetical protein
MKAFWKLLLDGSPKGVVAVLLLMAAQLSFGQTQASADLIAYERFDYTEGTDLLGQNGGVGWTSAWGPRDGFVVPANSK